MIVTLAEAKERLSIDFDIKDSEIEGMVNAIEAYLSFATGLDLKALKAELSKESDPENLLEVNQDLLDAAHLAKEYVLLKAYLDYYMSHTEIDDMRLTQIIKQLQVVALAVR